MKSFSISFCLKLINKFYNRSWSRKVLFDNFSAREKIGVDSYCSLENWASYCIYDIVLLSRMFGVGSDWVYTSLSRKWSHFYMIDFSYEMSNFILRSYTLINEVGSCSELTPFFFVCAFNIYQFSYMSFFW